MYSRSFKGDGDTRGAKRLGPQEWLPDPRPEEPLTSRRPKRGKGRPSEENIPIQKSPPLSNEFSGNSKGRSEFVSGTDCSAFEPTTKKGRRNLSKFIEQESFQASEEIPLKESRHKRQPPPEKEFGHHNQIQEEKKHSQYSNKKKGGRYGEENSSHPDKISLNTDKRRNSHSTSEARQPHNHPRDSYSSGNKRNKSPSPKKEQSYTGNGRGNSGSKKSYGNNMPRHTRKEPSRGNIQSPPSPFSSLLERLLGDQASLPLPTQDLLLIGLIFVLSIENTDSDLVLILLALLFISSEDE